MIGDKLQKIIGEAMKAHDEVRVSTLRLLSSAFNYEIGRQAKQRRDSIEAYKKAGANDRAEKEQKELEILQEFLPPEMSDEELVKLVDQAIGQTGAMAMSDMGKVIGLVKEKAPTADGAKIAGVVRSKLSG